MKCEDAIESIPWLLNGTLEVGERKEVLRHLESCESCKEILAKSTRLFSSLPTHPDTETLLRLAADEDLGVPEDQALALRRHVSRCQRCAEAVQLATRSNQDFWREESEAEVLSFPVDRSLRRWRRLAVAACLAATLGFGGWIQSLLSSGNQADPGRLKNVSLLEIHMGIDRGSAEDLDYAANTPTLRVELGGLGSDALTLEDSVVLLDSEDETLWAVQGLIRDPLNDVYSFYLPKAPPEGILQVRILGPDGKIKREKSFRLVPYQETKVEDGF